MIFYFKITKHFQFLVRKFEKNKFCAPFQFYFLCKHEQLLILTGIGVSTSATLVWTAWSGSECAYKCEQDL
jgi:hypothetical protein